MLIVEDFNKVNFYHKSENLLTPGLDTITLECFDKFYPNQTFILSGTQHNLTYKTLANFLNINYIHRNIGFFSKEIYKLALQSKIALLIYIRDDTDKDDSLLIDYLMYESMTDYKNHVK